MNEGNWFAVHTRPRCEKKVVDSLAKKKITTYFPLNKTYREWNEKKRVVFDPLFSSCVFVYLNDKQQLTVRQNSGVVNFLYWLDKPAVISSEEIDAIKRFLEEYSSAKLEKISVKPDEIVQSINIPVMFRKGNVLEVRNSTAKIMLPSLGHVLIADLRKDNSENIPIAEGATLYVNDIVS